MRGECRAIWVYGVAYSLHLLSSRLFKCCIFLYKPHGRKSKPYDYLPIVIAEISTSSRTPLRPRCQACNLVKAGQYENMARVSASVTVNVAVL